MKYSRWLMCAVLAAAPVMGITGFELTAAGAGGAVAAAPVESQATIEMKIEFKKAQIQAALSEKIAQVKEDELKALQAKNDTSPAGEDALLSAQLDAIAARAGAESAKIDMEVVDTQLKSGQADMPQNPNQPPTATTIQLLRMESRKAGIQSSASAKVVDIRQKQYDRALAQQKAGALTEDKVSDAMLDLEAAKATLEISKLDEELMDSRVSAATGGRH